ncbi:hypothetical protein B0F88_10393 [Methylobacter tundripaludum]|uniref:Uncharacterized protein n=1 Tax=Methylobacter tundripaludum TaxID=173365 RepID=A0A2S6H5G1_9GAMM|nr:hypothetical protein [Methylobacter tundripaludum]PPK72660.1 hypothetical protein B0F88_10393 [Methylobacter tundripaludum]
MNTSNNNEITRTQVSIALAKLFTGTWPGDEMWGDLDYQALEFALGCSVDRKPYYKGGGDIPCASRTTENPITDSFAAKN